MRCLEDGHDINILFSRLRGLREMEREGDFGKKRVKERKKKEKRIDCWSLFLEKMKRDGEVN